MEVEGFRSHFTFVFFSFAISFLLFSLIVRLLKSRPCGWCNCAVCESYVASSWSSEFDNLCDWYTHLLKQSPTRTIHVHVLGNVITAEPANVEHMLKTRFDNYPKGKPFSAILGDFLGRGIFNVDGELWQFQRKLAFAELAGGSVRAFTSHIVDAEIRRRLLPLLNSAATADEDVILDLQDVFRRFAFDNICKISFGVDPGCLHLSLPMSEFAAAFDKASMLSAWRATATVPAVWQIKRFLNVGSERELREAIGLVNRLAEEVIRQRRKLGFASSHDLLSHFMGSVDDDRLLRDIVVSFLLAGRDTVASALTCFFKLLSQNPAVASAIRDEIRRVGGEKPKEMHYLHAAIYESMRLFPPVQFDSKFCLADDVLPDGTPVVKGTRVTYHAYAMGRMEELWGEDAAEFRPERWLQNGAFVPVSPFKYPVFHAGLRICVGKEMALMEMKAVITAVVSSFDIDVVDGRRSPKFAPGLTASLGGGLPVRVRRRNDVSYFGLHAFVN
ncbi:cytochrome P450 94C1-like [Typha angustifolia]|uniref:cytochrome P450 94C1-like n=1 Tax=Typha angustifolia TaxID=59011 RepID=UPI003C2C3EDC